jgi:4-amino-4-deoxy-L-arabinose transferase-like glycosyltransferase
MEDSLRGRYVPIFVVTAILVAGSILRFSMPPVKDYRTGADEGYYLRYAISAANEGIRSLRGLADGYLADKGEHIFPSPIRAGHIVVTAAWMKLINRYDFQALSWISAVFSILTMIVGYLMARRLFDGTVATFSMALFAVSPISLAMSRRALQDSSVAFFVVLSAYLFYLMLTDRRPIYKALFAVSFYMAVIVKESSVVLSAFFVFYILWNRAFLDRGSAVLGPLLAVIAAIAAALATFTAVTGSPKALASLASIILTSPATNEYAVRFQSGGLERYIKDFFLVSPAVLILGVAYCLQYFVRQDDRYAGQFFLIVFFIVGYIGFSFFSKNLRYVLALDVPLRIMASALCVRSASYIPRWGAPIAASACLFLCATDLSLFNYYFLVHSIYDPVTANFAALWKV